MITRSLVGLRLTGNSSGYQYRSKNVTRAQLEAQIPGHNSRHTIEAHYRGTNRGTIRGTITGVPKDQRWPLWRGTTCEGPCPQWQGISYYAGHNCPLTSRYENLYVEPYTPQYGSVCTPRWGTRVPRSLGSHRTWSAGTDWNPEWQWWRPREFGRLYASCCVYEHKLTRRRPPNSGALD